MITSTANNFGCGPIEIKDYQDSKMVVLNAKFTIDTSSEDFKNADVLEITVPDLSISKSADAGCYYASRETMWEGKSYETTFPICTAVRTWIKDKNTVCIEKFSEYDDLDQITVWLCSMYPVVGKRSDVKVYEKATVTYTAETTSLSPSDLVCVVEDGWCFLHMYLYNATTIEKNQPIVGTLNGFPEDVDIEIPIVGGSHQADHGGSFYCDASISAGKFNVPNPNTRMANTGYEPFVMIYAVSASAGTS